MDKNLKNILIILGILFLATTLIVTGICVGRIFLNPVFPHMMRYDSGFSGMWRSQNYPKFGQGYSQGMMGQVSGYGVMDNYSSSSDYQPLTIDEARLLFEEHISSRSINEFEISEIMIFDNNAYAIIVEKETGIGAFELLIDPNTKKVFPEYGPNMMWNEKYGMMNNNRYSKEDYLELFKSMTISQDKAEAIAQEYLDDQFSGSIVSHDITAFYGYYTMDIELNGEITGMLSVNGFTGQVFYHSWHGEFIEMVH